MRMSEKWLYSKRAGTILQQHAIKFMQVRLLNKTNALIQAPPADG